MAFNQLTRSNGIEFQFIPHASGLARLLGFLEAEVMQILWAHGPLKVRQVRALMSPQRGVAHPTVMTVCSRLAEKGLLKRVWVSRGNGGYLYTPTITEAEFVHSAVRLVVDRLIEENPDLVVDGMREVGYMVTAKTSGSCPVSVRRL